MKFLLGASSALSIVSGRLPAQEKPSSQAAFTDEERNGLRLGADSVRNTALGFAFPNPGPKFIVDSSFPRQTAESFGGQMPPDYLVWALRDTAGHQAVMMQAIRIPGITEEQFRNFASGMRSKTANSRVLRDEMVWDNTRREAVFAFQHPNGLYMVTRCVSRTKPDYILCLATYSGDSTGLANVSKGLAFSK